MNTMTTAELQSAFYRAAFLEFPLFKNFGELHTMMGNNSFYNFTVTLLQGILKKD
jgi:hypothetical protein